ncbi:ferritin-like domain-containing protein [Nodosilinea nodulosa]|uniref:ferritin-like domain-containing protein n=1 Tax=Nodosilinea nodulosa TaxID=416001 RepID=UPI0002E41387|nr:ferritin-like domain-containing protein [Nodosilinea nodulosa]
MVYDIADCLRQVFADLWKMEFLAYSIHWNLKDCPFLAVHQWTQGIYESLAELKDETAERIRQLDSYPLGSLSEIAQWSSVIDIPLPCEKDIAIPLFINNLEKVIDICNTCAKICQDQNDFVSLDLLTRLLKVYQKNRWMAKSQMSQEAPISGTAGRDYRLQSDGPATV